MKITVVLSCSDTFVLKLAPFDEVVSTFAFLLATIIYFYSIVVSSMDVM